MSNTADAVAAERKVDFVVRVKRVNTRLYGEVGRLQGQRTECTTPKTCNTQVLNQARGPNSDPNTLWPVFEVILSKSKYTRVNF